ncbi:MAG: AbiH family protein [Flavobacterium sp.]|jgi:hypothetical protein
MNRLIIIGNGFDLAHGLKSSYHDFILYYFKESFISALNNLRQNMDSPHNRFYYYKDELIEIKIDFRNPKESYIPFLDSIQKVSEFESIYKKLGIKVTYNFEMLKIGVNKLTEYNWVDFEIEYFNELYRIKTKGFEVENRVRALNENFDVFKSKLEIYLKKQEENFHHNFAREKLIDCFCEKILSRDVDITSIADELPKRILFLNFNYTNTLEPYIRDCNQNGILTEINYIHGDLHYNVGKPIFGFGDEIDKRYADFENEGNNELFKHIKTFEYLKSNNYSNLTRFIANDKFQVQIYGHSCGLSDRTMFKEILEHDNCLSVKLFYHEKEKAINDYTEKTYEIYRHFTDKNMMRNKVVNEQYCRAMPQPIKEA